MYKYIKKPLTLFLLFVASSTWAGNLTKPVNLTLSMQQTTVGTIINTITKQTGYEFSYEESILDNVLTKINVEAKNESIENILKEVFSSASISYKVEENRIYLKEENTNKLSNTTKTQQNEKTIRGTVVDANNIAIIGANIIQKGTSNGTVTDIDGNFTLTLPSNSEIEVTYIGYMMQTINVANKSTFNIILKEDTQTLDEVVVVGYGVQKKVNMTGSISTIKTEELNSIATPNLSNTLAGRAPGVNITGNSGLMGASSEVRIRGAMGDPLYVIDGITRDKAAFDALEANEVDELSFLKDAATASIYGSRAGNGVVLVTTKSGTVLDKPVFNYQGSYTFMEPTMELMSDRTTATDELIYQNRVSDFLGIAQPNGEKEFDYFKDRSYNVNDYIWQTPWNTKHSMSVSGGSDKITYYALASYIGEEGSYKNLSNNKFNLRSNVTAKITKYIKMNVNIAANQQNQKRFYWPFSGDDEQTVGDLYRCTFNWPKTYPFYLQKDGTPADNQEVTDYPVQTPMGSWQAWSVIDQVIGDRYIKTRKREMNAILSFDIDLSFLTKGLSTKFVGNYVGNDYMRKKYLTYQHNYAWSPANADDNRFIPAAPDPNKINVFNFSQNQEFLSYNVNSLWSEQLNWFVNYANTFGDHDVSGTLVWEQAKNGGEYSYTKTEDPLTNYDQTFVYSTDTERRWGNSAETTGGRLSWIGRFNYSFMKRYIAEFSFRYDGNTLFPESKRWGFFPSVSAAWRISDEPFMENASSWLDNLKIRMSYGTTGNDLNVYNEAITPFSYIPTFQSGSSYIYGNSLNLGITPGDTPNPYLTWATSHTYNFGFDYAVLNNHLSGDLDVFYKKEDHILGSRIITLPDTYGQDLAPENYAERSWKGFEFNAAWRDQAGSLAYTIYGNIGYVKDQWDKLDETALYSEGGNLYDLTSIGNPMSRIIGYKTVKMVRTQEDLDAIPDGFTQFGREPYLGGLLFEDIRGEGYAPGPDGKIDQNDIALLSDKAAPRFNYGFGTNLKWKGISLDLHFQGVGGYDRLISNLGGIGGIRQYGGSIRPYYPIWADDVWTKENPNAKYPRPVGSNWAESGTGNLSYWIRNGAYLRLKNLNVGYDLPKNLISMFGLTNAQIFCNATNLFVISAMTEFQDPEQDDYDSYPLMKSFTFGLDIKF